MRLYKEKYGKHLAENPEPKSQGRKKGRRRRGKHPGTPGAGRAESAPGSEPAAGGDTRTATTPPPAPGDGGDRGGLFGRIFNAPRKEDDRD